MKHKQNFNLQYKCKVHSTKLLTKNEKNFTSKFFSFIAGVIDTADKHSFTNSANFEKIRNNPNGILWGPGDTELWKKTWSQKSHVRLL